MRLNAFFVWMADSSFFIGHQIRYFQKKGYFQDVIGHRVRYQGLNLPK